MADHPECKSCNAPLLPEDLYCGTCGRRAGSITWSWSLDGRPGEGPVVVRPGDRFFLLAHNAGPASVRIALDVQRARGVALEGASAFPVEGGRREAFALRHRAGEPLGGVLLARSEDGPRRAWWERVDWRETPCRLPGPVRLREEKWILGSPTLVFPPGVRAQPVRVWNDSDAARAFESEVPAGCRVTCYGVPIDQKPPAAGAGNGLDLVAQLLPMGQRYAPDSEWRAGPEGEAVPLVRMEKRRPEAGADVVVAIDFGTRNTGIRVRWRRTLVPSRPAGTVDVVGDRAGSARFPTEMVLHRQERYLLWGTDAAEYRGQKKPDEVEIRNLKTFLREGEEQYTRYRSDWTNEELLGRYFERLFERLDAYFRTVDPATPLSRDSMEVRYIVTRPVLDANEGDRQGERYEHALKTALERCGVPAHQIVFAQEPVAAAIGIARTRQQELLSLPEGAAVAVVDAGGGTTDVALACVRFREGQVTLEIAGSYALHLTPDNPALPALEVYGESDRREVGGNALDCALTDRLRTHPADLLETDGRPIPAALDVDPGQGAALIDICRRMKEGFATSSQQYLNRPRGEAAPEGEVLPFPNRPEYEGLYLAHYLFDERLLTPILQPVVEDLSDRMGQAQAQPEGIRPSQVQRVFYVGGTNIDPFVRQRFGRAFPSTHEERDPDAQSPARIAERLNAVVEGAVWFDEQLFASSPLSLLVKLQDTEKPLVTEGATLLPQALARPRFETCMLGPWEELDAVLVVSGGGLAAPAVVARAFCRNESDEPQEVTLRLIVSREKGAAASLLVGDHEREQWRFALVESRE